MTDAGTIAATAALSGTLAAASLGKLGGGMERLRRDLRQFADLPDFVAPTLVAAELTLALALLGPAAGVAAAFALALFAAFSWFVSTALARGAMVDCGCFGAIARIKVSAMLLALDLALLGASLFLVLRFTGLAEGTIPELALVTGSVLLAGLTAQSARANFFPDVAVGLAKGAPVPGLVAHARDGAAIPIGGNGGAGMLLLFVSAECPACLALVRAAGDCAASSAPWFVVPADDNDGGVDAPLVQLAPARVVGKGAQGLARVLRVRARPAIVAVRDGAVLETVFPATPARFAAAMARMSIDGPRLAGREGAA